MGRKRRKGDYTENEIPMTPMIDVVFQLFIYFILTMRPIDIFTNLDVSRPMEDKSAEATPNINLLRINIYPGNRFALNERPMALPAMERMLRKLAESDPNQTTLIMSSVDSRHSQLIGVLDMCAKVGLSNLSVLSTD